MTLSNKLLLSIYIVCFIFSTQYILEVCGPFWEDHGYGLFCFTKTSCNLRHFQKECLWLIPYSIIFIIIPLFYIINKINDNANLIINWIDDNANLIINWIDELEDE